MTDTRKAQLEIGVNAGPAEDGFKRVERAAQGMGQQVSKEAANTAQAMKGMGEQAKASAKEQETATRSMIASVQRATAAYEAGEKGTAKYFEVLAKQRGLDMAAIKPHLDAMRAVEEANAKVGVSAKQTAAAMRGVPAQFTDIVTSLQGGQAPLTVLLQQGGQLKDMFGGAGNAARALGGYVVGLVNPFTVAAAAAGVWGYAIYKGSQEAEEFRKSLVMTGNAAGASVAQLAGMAESIGAGWGKTTGAAAAALAQLAATGEVGRASLLGFATTALDAERTLGIAVKDIAKNFADLAKDPAAASLKLNDSMHYLTASTYAQIKAAQDLGQTTKAASMAQDAYNQALKGRTAEVLANAGTIERAWSGIKNAASGAWDAMLGVGRPVSVGAQLSVAQKNLEAALEKRKRVSNDSAFAPALDKEIAKLREQVGYIGEMERLQKRAGDSAAERIAREEAGIKAQQDGLKYLSDEQKMRNDIAQQTATMVKAGKTQAEIEERIQQIRASYAKKGGGALGAGESEAANLRAQVKEAQLYLDALQQQGAEMDKLTTGEKAVLKIREELKGNLTAQVRLQKDKALSEAETLANIQRRIEAEKDVSKYISDSIKLQAAAVGQTEKDTEALKKQAVAEREAMASIGLTKEAIADLTAAKYIDSAASKERLANTMAEAGEPELLIKKIREQAAALRDLAAAKRERGTAETLEDMRKANAKAAEDAQKEWQKTADKIQDALSDALMRGFENGKTFAQNLRDTLINMFKTMVLRPVISGVVTLGMGAVGLGAPGMATAQGVNGVNAASNAYSAYQAGNTAFSLGAQWAAGTMSAANVGATLYGNAAAAVYGDGLSAMLAANGAYGTAAGAGTAAAGGSSIMASAAAAGPYVAAAVAALNALGVFRSEKTVGGGLVGTLGTGSLQSYDLQRRGGTLFNGPSYSVQGLAATAQTAALENAFVTLRTSTAQMAKDLGLSTDKVNQFTMAVGDVQVHPDIEQLGLVLDGLSEPQKLERINQLLQKSADGMAQVVLGAGATAQQLAQIYAATMQERAGLTRQLLQAEGNTVMLRKFERDALQESNRALYDQIISLQDSKVAAEQAAQAQAAIAQQRDGLQTQLDQLLGNTAALREKERNALDESNRALYDQINALQDSRTAAEQAAQAQQAITQEALGLQTQLDQLLGNTAALRERERNAISEANRGLYDQIQTLKDKQAADAAAEQAAKDQAAAAASAAQESARAAEQVRSAWASIGDSITDEINRIRGVLTTGTAYSLSTAQTQFAIATAQARAGDQTAAQSLPQLSKTLLDAAAASATSAIDLKRIQGQTAGMLAQTLGLISGRPVSAASLTNPAGASPAQPIYSTGFAPQLQPLSMPTASPQADPNAALLQELQALRAQVARLEASGAATATNTLKTKDLLVQVTRDGVAMRTVPA